MSSTRAPGSISRRRMLQTASLLPLSVAGVGLAQSAASATSNGDSGNGAGFDITTPATALFTDKNTAMVRTVMQSLAVDAKRRHVYVLQLVQANTSLPGDEPGDETYARRLERGDMSLTKLDVNGRRLGVMYLKFFGHGVSMGIERVRGSGKVYLWTEIDTRPKSAEVTDGRGSKLTRFQFVDGAVLDAEHDSSLFRRDLMPDAAQTTCNIDQEHNRLVMRYWKDSEFRYALFDLDHVKEERSNYEPLYDLPTPPEVNGLFQGYASFGDHFYATDGTKYNEDTNPPPPEGRGDTQLTKVRWSTGEVEQHILDVTGSDLHRREPEGLTIALGSPVRGGKPDNRPRLYSSFGTSATADPSEDRLCSIFYRDAYVG